VTRCVVIHSSARDPINNSRVICRRIQILVLFNYVYVVCLRLPQLPSATLKHMDSNGGITDIKTDELTAGKKVSDH
jgi:hypothetical protein